MRTTLSLPFIGALWTALALGFLLNILAFRIFAVEIWKDIFLFGTLRSQFPFSAMPSRRGRPLQDPNVDKAADDIIGALEDKRFFSAVRTESCESDG